VNKNSLVVGQYIVVSGQWSVLVLHRCHCPCLTHLFIGYQLTEANNTKSKITGARPRPLLARLQDQPSHQTHLMEFQHFNKPMAVSGGGGAAD